MKPFRSRCLTAVLAIGVMAVPGYAAAQTMGSTTGQNPASFSSAGGASMAPAGYAAPPNMPTPTPSPFNQPAVPLGSDGQPLRPSISTVPPLPGQPGSDGASKLNVGRIPNEGEKDANGQTIHYQMAGHEKGTGYGALEGVKLPPRSYNNVEWHMGQ
jgi:hypothetical protein